MSDEVGTSLIPMETSGQTSNGPIGGYSPPSDMGQALTSEDEL